VGRPAELELEFEHAGELYRVRQGYKQAASGRGTATVDFERPRTGWTSSGATGIR
jgi:hypothetical protein